MPYLSAIITKNCVFDVFFSESAEKRSTISQQKLVFWDELHFLPYLSAVITKICVFEVFFFRISKTAQYNITVKIAYFEIIAVRNSAKISAHKYQHPHTSNKFRL